MRVFVIVSTGVAIVTGVIITILLFIFRLFALGGVGIGILCLLFLLLGRLTSEEGVVFVLKRHGGSCEYTNSKISFSKKAIARLEKRGIVTIEDGIVRLVNPDYPCIFDESDK